jgi:hypothetical protein
MASSPARPHRRRPRHPLPHRRPAGPTRRHRSHQEPTRREPGSAPMSALITLEHQHRLPPHYRVLPLLAVGAARLLATLRPSQLHRILEFARRGARPATAQQAHTARPARWMRSACAAPEKAACNAPSPPPSTAAPTAPGPPGAPEYAPTPSPPTPGSKSTTSPSANPTPGHYRPLHTIPPTPPGKATRRPLHPALLRHES